MKITPLQRDINKILINHRYFIDIVNNSCSYELNA